MAEMIVIEKPVTPAASYMPTETPNNLETVISYLESMNGRMLHAEVLKTENERLKLEIKELKKRNEELEGISQSFRAK